MRSGPGHRRRPADRLGARRRDPWVGIPLGRKSGEAVSVVTQMPADRWRRTVAAIPVIPVRPTRKGERQEEGHGRTVHPQVAHVPAPRVWSRPGPAVRVDGVPRRQQVADLEMDMRPGRVPGAAAERDQLAAGHVLSRVDEELIVVEVGGAIIGVVDHHAEAAAVAPLAIDDGPVVGGHDRRVGGHGVVGAPVAVVGVAGSAVKADHDPVLLTSRVMVIRP